MLHQLDTKKMTLDLKPITISDLMLLLAKYGIKENDKKIDLLLDYFTMLYECGHNGFHLLSDYKVTTKKEECCQCSLHYYRKVTQQNNQGVMWNNANM